MFAKNKNNQKTIVFGEMVVHDKKWSFTIKNGRSRFFHAHSRFFHGWVMCQAKPKIHNGRWGILQYPDVTNVD